MPEPRRLLLLSYYYPPAGGPGVQRALKTSRYLPRAGWHPTVVTVAPDSAAWPERDRSLLADVPPEADVVRTRSWDPYAAYARLAGRPRDELVGVSLSRGASGWKERLARLIRANVFVPDARVGWLPFALAAAREAHARRPCDAILTTGPPQSTHLTGLLLARATGLPWVADLRDPWVEVDFRDELPQLPPARALDAWLERRVLTRADAVTTVTTAFARGLERRVPACRPVVIPNGFDPADFAAAPQPIDREHFTIAYLGNLNEARNPSALWPALARLDARGAAPRLRVRLVGMIEPVALASARAAGVEHRVEVEGYVPHTQAVREMQRAAVLLLVVNRVEGAEGIETGKVFEYLAARRPVLALGPPHGNAARILTETGAGQTFDWDDADRVERWLLAAYRAWEAGGGEASSDPDAVDRYSRAGQARAIAGLLDTLVDG